MAAKHERQLAGEERALQNRRRLDELVEEVERNKKLLHQANEDIDGWRELAEEQSDEASRRLEELEKLRRFAGIRADLVTLQLDRADSEGLPDWVAAVASGAAPDANLPEELLEDIRSFASRLALPQHANPEVTLKSTGTLTAGGGDFLLSVGLRDPVSLRPAVRSGTSWKTDDGQTYLMDLALASALDTAEGPLPEAATPVETTRARELWWGRLRRRLSSYDVRMSAYLANTDAVVVERFEPTLRLDDNGEVELLVGTDDLDAEALTSTLDKLHPRSKRHPTIVTRGEDGEVRRQRIVLAPAVRKALPKIQSIRRERARATPYLLDDPATLLDDSAFDLSKYGDRVIGLGVAVYRASPSIAETDGSGRKRIALRDDLERVSSGSGLEAPDLSPQDEAELAALLVTAAGRGQHYIRFKDTWIRVPSPGRANELSETITGPSPKHRGVLLIEENLDDTAFQVADQGVGLCADVPESPPGLETSELLPHQHVGFSWLAGHALVGPNATDHGLIADEMGLGKTLQVLSLMSLLEEAGTLRPALIVAPLTLLQNWESEADRFFPGRFRRRAKLHGGKRLKATELQTADIVLASYEAVRSQQLELGRVRWQLMVCDESHRIKNPTTQTAKAIMAMDAARRIAMTGTPVQNSLDDLWSQFDWLQPGFLGDLKAFRNRFSPNMVASERDAAIESLRATVRPRMLRRLKSQVAEALPPKHHRRIELRMGFEQAQLYSAVLSELSQDGTSTLSVLHRLFGVCSFPEKQYAGVGQADGNAKLRWLMELLEQIRAADEKVVIFAEWYALQDQLSAAITQRFGIPVDRINGTVAANHRQWKVDAFNASEGFGVLTLGPRAAGVGLNIASANHVVHYTRHWNPALEAQATDRCHRIGQSRPVMVYLPIATHHETATVEQHLDQLLRRKEALANDVIVPTDSLSVERELRAAMRPTQQGQR